MIGIFLNIIFAVVVLTQLLQNKFNGPTLTVYHIIILILYLIGSFSAQVYIVIVIDSLYKRFRDEEFPTSVSTSGVRKYNL